AKQPGRTRNLVHFGIGHPGLRGPPLEFVSEERVLQLRPKYLVLQDLAGRLSEIAMAPAMVAHLEEWVCHELHRPILMRPHPFAAGKEGRGHPLITQIVHDVRLIAGDLVLRLTEVEREGDEPFVASWVHTANSVACFRTRRRRELQNALHSWRGGV